MSTPDMDAAPAPAEPGQQGRLLRWWRAYLASLERRPFMAAWQGVAAATLLITVVGGMLVRLTDPESIDSLAQGMWWAVQTVTTVGYGDTLPESFAGRMVAVLVMMIGVAFLTVTTAAIGSLFSESTRRRIHRNREDPMHIEVERLHERMDVLIDEIRELRAAVDEGTTPPAPRG
ncbi:MAG: potassium channel family protein [Thermoleophilia bacterium]